MRLINERISAINGLLPEQQNIIANAEKEALKIQGELLKLKAAADEYDTLKSKIAAAKGWLDKEKLLPVAREQLSVAEKRIREITDELSDIDREICIKRKELEEETQTALGSDELQRDYDSLNIVIRDKQTTLNVATMNIGALKQQISDIEKNIVEISELQKKANEMSEKAVIYEELKNAFSQDGIPHNIIRSIVPLLTSRANGILGQMTDGRMGLEFKMDKIQKSNKKETAVLDILIEEYGKGKLPYLSKSGGEKVKAALSAILGGGVLKLLLHKNKTLGTI